MPRQTQKKLYTYTLQSLGGMYHLFVKLSSEQDFIQNIQK